MTGPKRSMIAFRSLFWSVHQRWWSISPCLAAQWTAASATPDSLEPTRYSFRQGDEQEKSRLKPLGSVWPLLSRLLERRESNTKRFVRRQRMCWFMYSCSSETTPWGLWCKWDIDALFCTKYRCTVLIIEDVVFWTFPRSQAPIWKARKALLLCDCQPRPQQWLPVADDSLGCTQGSQSSAALFSSPRQVHFWVQRDTVKATFSRPSLALQIAPRELPANAHCSVIISALCFAKQCCWARLLNFWIRWYTEKKSCW